jgi:hypothetical protein
MDEDGCLSTSIHTRVLFAFSLARKLLALALTTIAQSGAMLAVTKAGVCAIVNTILPSFPPAIELPSTSPTILWEAFSEFGISCYPLTPAGQLRNKDAAPFGSQQWNECSRV